MLQSQDPADAYAMIDRWRLGLEHVPISTLLLERIDSLISLSSFQARALALDTDLNARLDRSKVDGAGAVN